MRRLIPLLILGGALTAGGARAGEARCGYENGALVVPAALGNIAGDFVLDASAPRSALHDTIAMAAGLTGETVTDDLRLAGEGVTGLEAAVQDLDARWVGFPTTIVGVIGADVLARYVVDIDFAPCRIALRRKPPALWRGAARLRVTMVAGVPAVTAEVSDGTAVRRGLFAVDTASAGVRLDPTEAAFSRPLADGVDPALRFRPPARLAALAVAGEVFTQTPAGLLEAPAPPLAGAIGDAVWSRFRMRLDLARRRLDLLRVP
jgi:hypothetical protein